LKEQVPDEVTILAECALLNYSMLLARDEHLRGIDFDRLTLELRAFDAAASVIATPREVVRKFFRSSWEHLFRRFGFGDRFNLQLSTFNFPPSLRFPPSLHCGPPWDRLRAKNRLLSCRIALW